jgi:DNA invertase Pin-like site-specific DNA recombinase
MNVVIYSRVSTEEQEYQRQIDDLKKYAASQKWNVLKTFEEKESGLKAATDRPQLNELLEMVKEGKIQKVLVTELTRLGRSQSDIHKTVQYLHENCVSLYLYSQNFETLDRECKETIQGKMFVSMLAMFSEMEIFQLRSRMASGYKRHRANGGKVGRNEGFKKPIEETVKYKEVTKFLKKNHSVREVMKLAGASQSVVMKIKKHLA